MTLVDIELGDVVPDELLEALSEDMVQSVLANIAASAYNHWKQLAGKELHASAGLYRNAIQNVQLMPGVAVIALVGEPANMIENGAGRIDMRDWLLGARVPEGPGGKKRSKDGYFYRSIPFRHQTPGSAGTQGSPMGDPYSGAMKGSAAMGKRIYDAAKRLPSTRNVGDARSTQWGGRLPAGMAPLLRDHHKTDIYAGMVKTVSAYEKKTDTTYQTFRTISTNPEHHADSWIRQPSTPGKQFAKKTSEFVAKMAPQAFAAYVAGMMKG